MFIYSVPDERYYYKHHVGGVVLYLYKWEGTKFYSFTLGTVDKNWFWLSSIGPGDYTIKELTYLKNNTFPEDVDIELVYDSFEYPISKEEYVY